MFRVVKLALCMLWSCLVAMVMLISVMKHVVVKTRKKILVLHGIDGDLGLPMAVGIITKLRCLVDNILRYE